MTKKYEDLTDDEKQKRKNINLTIFGLAAIFMVAIFLMPKGESNYRQKPKTPEQAYLINAETLCKPLIESVAKYNIEWTNGFGESVLSRGEKRGNTIVYVGDSVKLQNGFGAYSNYIYKCTYDIPTDTAVLNGIEQGKFSN